MSRHLQLLAATGLLLFAATTNAENPKPMVRITTNLGAIEVELDRKAAPQSVENFLAYAKKGFYDGTVFHRVIKGFMIQGGGFTKDMDKKPTAPPIMNEADNGLKNKTGTLAMARTMEPHSASAQFFINVADNDFLDHRAKTPDDWGYAVFGKVTDGMDTVQTIAGTPTTSVGPFSDVPKEPVVIEKVEIIE